MTRLPLLLCALALLSACPTFPEDGLYACETDDDCLDDQFCIEGACLSQLPPPVCGDGFCSAVECELCPDDCGGADGETCLTCANDEVCGAEEDCACRDCGGRVPECGLCPGTCPDVPSTDQCNYCPECGGAVACGAPTEDCTLRGDEDGDSAADCLDDECISVGICSGLEVCELAEDEDGDGYTDCADPECFEAGSCQPVAELCDGDDDEDGDGLYDCLDADCEFDAWCALQPYSVFHGGDACADLQADTDGDGLRPCSDPECVGLGLDCSADGESNCINGGDDDGAGGADCDDPACYGIGGCPFLDISPEAAACTNEADDDRDGRVDCADPSCHLEPACSQTVEDEGPLCGNGLDDDRDGNVDCFDTAACPYELAPGCRPGRCPELLGDVQPIASLSANAGLGSWTGSYVAGATIASHERCGETVASAPYVLFGFQPPADGEYYIDALGSGVPTAIAVHMTKPDATPCELVRPAEAPGSDAACPRDDGSSAWASSGYGTFYLWAVDLHYVLLVPLDPSIPEGTPLRLNILAR